MSEMSFSAAITELGDKIANLTIVQAVELKTYLKEKYKIEPAAGGVVMQGGGVGGGGGGGGEPEKKAEPTEFNVILDAVADPAKKITVIKVVREITGLGLKEAKDLVEGAPKPVKEGIDKATAEKFKKQLEDNGGKVTIKPAG
jgi:large subunit ribosomal protein L7/L12